MSALVNFSWDMCRSDFDPVPTYATVGRSLTMVGRSDPGTGINQGAGMPEYNADRESYRIYLATRTVWIWALHSILDAFGRSAGMAAISYC